MPDTVYTFENIPIEVRSKYDPYTAYAKQEYHIDTDTTFML